MNNPDPRAAIRSLFPAINEQEAMDHANLIATGIYLNAPDMLDATRQLHARAQTDVLLMVGVAYLGILFGEAEGATKQ